MSRRFNLIFATAAFALTGSMSGAAVVTNLVTLTGGDAGEGFTPPTNVVAIVDFGGANSGLKVQGLTFPTSDANISTTAATQFNDTDFHPSFESGSANDQNLTAILRDGITNGGSFTVTVSNLTAGNTYRVESLFGTSQLDGTQSATNTTGDRVFPVLINGTQVGADLTSSIRGFDLVSDGVVADSNGQILISYNAGSGTPQNQASFVNAVVVSSTPEPGALALLGLSATGLLARRRRSC